MVESALEKYLARMLPASYEQYRKKNGIGPDGEKLIPVIPKDMETKVNLAKGVMTNLMIEYDELIEERREISQAYHINKAKLDAKIIELENLWREI